MANASSSNGTNLDQTQYTARKILLYERIFGPNCLSSGGLPLVQEMCSKLRLHPGQTVLDVGCGIGGNSFHLAQEFGVDVLGVDVSENMLSLAAERLQKFPDIKNLVRFKHCDIIKENFPPDSFDAIFSKDAILHIAEKEKLFRKFWDWLHPGGYLMIGDYCFGESKPTKEFLEYVKQRNYSLLTVHEYSHLLEKIGFRKKIAEDRNQYFTEILKKELEQMERQREDLLKDFHEEDYEYIKYGKEMKLQHSGNQTLGIFLMQKP